MRSRNRSASRTGSISDATKGTVEIGLLVVRGVERIGDVVDRAAIEDDPRCLRGVLLHAADVEEQLDAVAVAGRLLAELDGVDVAQGAIRFLFVAIPRERLVDVGRQGALAHR